MHRLIFGHSFAEVVALILLPGLAFYILNKKKASVRGNAEDYDTDPSGSSTTPIGTNFGGSSSTLTETTNGGSSSSTAPSGNCYEVFLSFRGRDTRDGFADHLYHGLDDARIITFRDNEKLRRGKKISDDLFAAIKNSKILIPILSVNYGTSSWCLNELVQIMECKKNSEETIWLPIFYKVEPSDVGHQKGSFGDEFRKREKRLRKRRGFDSTTLEKWKEALEEVSSLKGHNATGPEGELVKSVVREVLSELIAKFELDIPENLIGIDSQVEEVMKFVANNSRAILFVREVLSELIAKFELDIPENLIGVDSQVEEVMKFVANNSHATLFVREVLSKLIAKFKLDIPENLIGIDSLVEGVMKFVANNSRATLFVGIHGMGGIGKTTLAKTIYNQLLNQFEYHSFIADIREKYKNGVEHLHNKLFRDILKEENLVHDKDEGIKLLSSKFKDKKMLILLDDVDADDHLKYLVRSRDWFSWGSVIIITTRDESILDRACVDHKHDHQVLDKGSSLILFSRYAFRKDAPPSEFEKLTDEVVSTTGNLPLSLKVLGSFLCDKMRGVWEDAIKQLRNAPVKEVRETLKISYDTLEEEEKQIFLDIACFFINNDLRIASYMWDACDFCPKKGIEVLRLRSLIKVGENHELIMHDQLRDLGREIIRLEDKREPCKRSRLWDYKEAMKVLEEDEGTKTIEAIHLSKDDSAGFSLTGKQFKKLRNLRFLNARGVHFSGDFKNSIKKLKWLQWEYCPSTFAANNFHVEELRVLDLCRSKISNQWRGWRFITMAQNLKYLNLRGCSSLKKTSFLSAFGNLEVLILSFCERIEQIDSSIENMKSLIRLHLSGCGSLKELPVEVGKLEALEQLYLQHSGIEELPDSIGDLQNLEILFINCTNIKELPNGIGRLRKLRELDTSYCRQLGGEMLESMRNLSSLQRLNLMGCKKVQSLSILPSSLTYLVVTCQSRSLPSLSNLTHLKKLHLYMCKFLEYFWEHPSTPLETSLITPSELEILDIDGCVLLEILDVSLFTHMRILSTARCPMLLEIQGLHKLKYLESLNISDCYSIERLDLSESKGPKNLRAEDCQSLVEIQGLERLEFLQGLTIHGCTSIERLDLPKSENLKLRYDRWAFSEQSSEGSRTLLRRR